MQRKLKSNSWGKLICLIIFIFFLNENIFSQFIRDEKYILYWYFDSENDTRFFKNKSIKGAYLKTDTLNGYELNFIYFFSSGCHDFRFFVINNYLNYDNVYNFFSNEIISFQTQNLFHCTPVSQQDTFSYTKEKLLYERNLFPDSLRKLGPLFKLNDVEFFEIYHVKVIVDIFTGDTEALHFFYPMLEKSGKTIENGDVIYYKYRSVLERSVIQEETVFGITRKKYPNKRICTTLH